MTVARKAANGIHVGYLSLCNDARQYWDFTPWLGVIIADTYRPRRYNAGDDKSRLNTH